MLRPVVRAVLLRLVAMAPVALCLVLLATVLLLLGTATALLGGTCQALRGSAASLEVLLPPRAWEPGSCLQGSCKNCTLTAAARVLDQARSCRSREPGGSLQPLVGG